MDENKYDTKTLQLFILALGDINGTIAEYTSLCKNLWEHPEHKIWVRAALLKRASLVSLVDDESCLVFLWKRISDSLETAEQKGVLSKEDLIEYLPSIINMIPIKAWERPLELWNTFLKLIIDEFQLDIEVEILDTTKIESDKYTDLALFFIKAIGSTWNNELNKLLESWEEKPEYEWLKAVKHSAKLNVLLDEEYRRLYFGCALNSANLFEEIVSMKPFERRRILLIKDIESGEIVWPEIKLNEIKNSIEWSFYFPVVRERKLGLLAREEQIGTLTLFGEESLEIRISDATGFLAAFLKLSKQALKLTKAAAGTDTGMLILSDKVQAELRPVEKRQVLLCLKWHIEG